MTKPSGVFAPGEAIGTSPWLKVDQEMISRFGRSTHDPDPMHMDPAWAAEESPYKATIAFGFQTIAMLSRLLYDTIGVEPERAELVGTHVMNYGFDRLRLVSPVVVDSRIRGVFKTKSCTTDDKGHEKVVIDVAIEIEGSDRPALVGDWVVIHVPVAQQGMAQTGS